MPMKTYLDCYPCFVRQALEAARQTGADERLQRAVLDEVLALLRQAEDGLTPPEIGDRVHRVRSEEGVAAPARVLRRGHPGGPPLGVSSRKPQKCRRPPRGGVD